MASHLVEVNDLSPSQLCHYIEMKQYAPIKQTLELLNGYVQDLQNANESADKSQLVPMLFVRLKDEISQVMRNDEIIIFPLINKHIEKGSHGSPQLPLSMIREKNKKIMHILEKFRVIANSYILKPEWTNNERLFFEELFTLDQMITQAIYLKENVLIPKMMKYND